MCRCVRAWACESERERVALLIQHATHMHYIVSLFMAPLALPYFSTSSHKRRDFRKKMFNKKLCFVFAIILSKIFLLLIRTRRGIVINVKMSSFKVPVVLVRF